jgi:hypothetical protein
VDVLRPSVSWLGGHRTLIFEFPLPEAIAAALARAAGDRRAPSPAWDRGVALGFFLVSLGYFHALARSITGSTVASRVATLAYAASPLALFYSRAAHVDFAAQAFAHALLWHGLRAVRGGGLAHAGAAAGLGTLGALIKAPYLAPVAAPLALAVLAAPGAGAFAGAAIALGVPAAAFAIWRRHVDAVNSAVPDWTFLPGFYKEVNPLWWYVGDWNQRLQAPTWIRLGRRVVLEGVGPALAGFALLGALARAPRRRHAERAEQSGGASGRALALAWLAGAIAYLLVFFPLNVIHNYYQVPFVAPLALLAGLGGAWLFDRSPAPLASALTAVSLMWAAWLPSSLGWYRVDWERVHAGEEIERRTPPGELVVVVDRGSEFSDPRLLHRADRYGWPIRAADATPALLARLRAEGARWLAWVEEPGEARLVPPERYEPGRTARVGPAPSGPASAGRDPGRLGTVHVYSLDRLAAEGVLP